MYSIFQQLSLSKTLLQIYFGKKSNLIIYFAGLVAVIFSISSRHVGQMDWDGARLRSKIAMGLSVTGIILTIIGVLLFVLIYYTKDNNS